MSVLGRLGDAAAPADWRRAQRRTFGTERLGALSDGVIAIGATLLVIELKIEPLAGEATLDWARVADHAPEVLGWAISFVMIGVIWFEQHYALAHAARSDVAVIVATLAQLALVSLIPFASSLVGEFPTSPHAATVFSVVVMANGLALAAGSFLIAQRPHLHGRPEAATLDRHALYQLVAYPATAALTIALAYAHHTLIGIAAWLVSPLALWAALGLRRRVARIDHPVKEPS